MRLLLPLSSRGPAFSSGQERGLLRPLLFKLPLKVGKPDNPWLTQVYVHQGDVPRELAQALTSRYSGWDKPEETVRRPTGDSQSCY